MKPNIALEKKLNNVAIIVSILVLALVIAMRKFKFTNLGVDFSFLPPIHASLNALTAVVLIYAFIQIRNRQVEKHKRAIYLAMIFSALFLLSYVAYHLTTEETRYGGEGLMKYIYFFILITHIILAGTILPFILFTFNRAFTGQFQRHKNMARWVFPLWLYVAITGPICYIMLLPYYK
jgi:putative membrane protein